MIKVTLYNINMYVENSLGMKDCLLSSSESLKSLRQKSLEDIIAFITRIIMAKLYLMLMKNFNK